MHCSLLKALLLQQQVTAILYANPDWTPAHGGELRLWLPPDASDRCSSEGASMADNAAPDQPNTGSAAPHDQAATDGLDSTTTLTTASDDRDEHNTASVPAAAPDDHAAADRHESESASAPTPDGHAATDTTIVGLCGVCM